MYQLLKQIAKTGIVTEPAPLADAALRALEQRLGNLILEHFGRALYFQRTLRYHEFSLIHSTNI